MLPGEVGKLERQMQPSSRDLALHIAQSCCGHRPGLAVNCSTRSRKLACSPGLHACSRFEISWSALESLAWPLALPARPSRFCSAMPCGHRRRKRPAMAREVLKCHLTFSRICKRGSIFSRGTQTSINRLSRSYIPLSILVECSRISRSNRQRTYLCWRKAQRGHQRDLPTVILNGVRTGCNRNVTSSSRSRVSASSSANVS